MQCPESTGQPQGEQELYSLTNPNMNVTQPYATTQYGVAAFAYVIVFCPLQRYAAIERYRRNYDKLRNFDCKNTALHSLSHARVTTITRAQIKTIISMNVRGCD